MTPQERRSMRREQVERCLSTDMSIREWCKLNHVAESTIYAWMARFRKEEPEMFAQPHTSEWIELTRESIAAQTALAVSAASPAMLAQTVTDGALTQPMHRVRDGVSVCLPQIVVRMKEIDIIIPTGFCEADIASVLRAVALL